MQRGDGHAYVLLLIYKRWLVICGSVGGGSVSVSVGVSEYADLADEIVVFEDHVGFVCAHDLGAACIAAHLVGSKSID